MLKGSKIVPVSKVSAGLGVAHGEKVSPVRRSLKSPAPFSVGGNGGDKRIALAQARSFVVSKDESAVLPDGTAQKRSELVALEGLLALVEIVDRVQLVVANELIRSAMNLVGSGFQDDVDGGATAAEFGAHGIFFSAKLLDGVGRRQDDHSTQSEFVVIYAVQQEIVVGYAQAVHRDGFVGALVFKHTTADVRSGLTAVCSRAEICELDKVSSIQRKLRNASFGFDRAQR